VATIFNIWSKSQFFRREEQNFISQNEIDNMALIMPSSGRGGRISATKSDGGASASAKKVCTHKLFQKQFCFLLIIQILVILSFYI